jgi:hypothetical protein
MKSWIYIMASIMTLAICQYCAAQTMKGFKS